MKKSYDNPLTITYPFGLFDFGGAGDITAIPVPVLYGTALATFARIEEIFCMAAEVFTTGGKIEVGNAADPNKYAQLLLLTLADTDALGLTDHTAELFDNSYGGKGVVLLNSSGENISQLEVVLTITGGTPTGQGFAGIVVSWW